MNIDLILDARADADELAELGVLAEQLGFSGIWVSSLLDGRDPFANMSVLARATQTISLGPIAINPWDMHPVRISGALHTLNELSNGRARVVIGGGGEALAALNLQPHRRVRAVHECVELIKLASHGERFDYVGQLYQARGYGLGWLKAAAPKVYVGANMDQMLRMAGRVADGIMLSDLPPKLARQAIAKARKAAADNDRDPAELWFSSFTAWHVYADEEHARQEAKRWLLLRGLFRPWVLQEFLNPDEVATVMASQASFVKAFSQKTHVIPGVPESITDKLVEALTLTAARNNIAALVEELQLYREAGLSSVSLRLYEQPAESMRLIAQCVLPRLQ
jgi:5,10-methylenetetrahydromethanopterin reductase